MPRGNPRDVRLSSVDLNLLVALDALLKEAHVTRAARRIGLSQSAMSHALTRLRDLLGDPLLVRSGRAMSLTPRARQIAGPLAEALRALERTLGPPAPFDPAQIERQFRIAAIDFAQLVLVPPLMTALQRRAPRSRLMVFPAAEPLLRAVIEGTVELAVGLPRDAPGLHQRGLMTETFVCVLRRGHPALRRRLTVRQFARIPHAVVSPRGRVTGAIDTALRPAGLSRDLLLATPSALRAALAVTRSDLVLTVARRVARVALRGLPLEVVEPPLALEPFQVTMIWHPRYDADPAHAFLRDQLADVAARA